MVDLGNLLLSKFLMIYLFGGLIILLYAKDKFNMPTYDKDAMGPFAQLPPQYLTIDARYRWGRVVYISLMLSLYTAICVIGPASFSNFEGAAGGLVPSIPGASNGEVWPVAAAAFLVSTGAANDNNMLGRIELLIRQYAHKSAYIPGTVSDLAFTLRTINIKQWLVSNQYIEETELRERQKALAALIGSDNFAAIKAEPEQEGQLAAWVRANILFYTLQQIFNKRPELSSTKLDYLTDLPENKQIFDNIRAAREALVPEFKNPTARDEDESSKVFAGVQRFSKDTSLMIAVLLSQTARNASYLSERLDHLGFQGVDLRDRSDHFTYTVMVNAFTLAGSLLVAIVLAAAWLPTFTPYLKWIHDVDLIYGTITIFTGTLVYLVMFKAMDYWRERSLDTLDWRENLESYVKLTLSASLLSCIVSVVLLVLVLSLFNSVKLVINGPVAFAQLFVFNFIAAALGTVFGLVYMRQAARLPRARLSLAGNLFSFTALLHAVIAALFVGALNLSLYMYNIYTAPKAILSALQTNAAAAAQDPKIGFSGVYPASQFTEFTRELNRMQDEIKRLELGSAETQLNKVRAICNLIGKPNGNVNAVVPRPAATTAMPPSSQNANPPPLFATAGSCKLGDLDAGDPRIAIASLLSAFEDSLVAINDAATQQYFAWAFPALAALLIAYCFGVGCRHWRAWWLNNDEDYLADLKRQIKESYGDRVDVEQCLTWPVPSLGNVTPIEAVRYEDYRTKLLGNVQRHKIAWPKEFYRDATIAANGNAGVEAIMDSGVAPVVPQ